MIRNTPLERHMLQKTPVWVKREDLCCPYPGPSFSKIRGVVAHIQSRPESVIGVLDTRHSKAGWGVAYACKELGRKCVVFWPRYKGEGDMPDEGRLPRHPQRMARKLGAETRALPAGRSAILYHQARKTLKDYSPDSYLMPNALKLQESVEENAREVGATNLLDVGTIVISISSGTIASGVLKGLRETGQRDYTAVLHMGYTRSKRSAQRYVEDRSGYQWKVSGFGLQPTLHAEVGLVDEGYSYSDLAKKGVKAPFPCNPYYDLKAWRWLAGNHKTLPKPILFWNIGA